MSAAQSLPCAESVSPWHHLFVLTQQQRLFSMQTPLASRATTVQCGSIHGTRAFAEFTANARICFLSALVSIELLLIVVRGKANFWRGYKTDGVLACGVPSVWCHVLVTQEQSVVSEL